MNYTITETFEMSGYTAVIEADQNLASLITDNFRMEVRDILTNQIEEITKEDLMKWGTSVDTDIDPSLWETQSCINNGGMYINFNGNTLTFKQIIPCLSGNIPMGYNSSQVSITFNDNDSIDFYSKTLPFFKRDLPKSDNYDVEPILSAGSARPDYDFDDFKNNILMSGCKSNFEYNTVGDLYVNNNMGHIKKYNNKSLTEYTKDYSKPTPKFYSDISAFYITTNQLGGITPYDFIDEYKGKHWISTIWNETTNEETDIDVYPKETAKSATIEFNSLTSDIVYNVYRQVIDDTYFQEDYRKNVLKFYIDFENHGINVDEPKPLVIQIFRQSNDKVINVRIENPNLYNGDQPHPLKDAKIYFEEIQKTGISDPYDIVQEGNILTFKLNGDIECGYSFIETAWLEKAYLGYSSDFVKQKTYIAIGNNDQPSISKPGYEKNSIFANVIGYKKYNKDTTPPTNIDDFNAATDAEDPTSHNLLLKEDECGIICFEIINKNYDKEWINTNLIQVILNNENLKVSPTVPFDISNNKTYFFVYGITCKELIETITDVEITFEISGTTACSGDWIDQDKSKFNSKWYFFKPDEPLQQIRCLTCEDTTDTNPCYEYTGDNLNPTIETSTPSYDHILDVYSRQDGSIIIEKTQYGIQRFKVVNPNKSDPSDIIKITIYKDNLSESFQFTFNDIPYTIILDSLNLIVKDIVGVYSEPDNYGTLTFNVYGITPSKIKAHVEITTNEMPIASDFFKADSSTVTWSEKSFIPKEWEEFNNYAIFTKSKLHLDGARIGIRSIYCTALYVDNRSTIDTSYSDDPNFPAGIYVDCSEQWSDGSYIFLNNANITDQGLQGSVKYANLNPPIDLKNNGENQVWYNAASKNVIFLTRDIDKTQYVTAINNNYVGSKMEVKSIEVPELPKFNINYDGTDNININDRQSITLNAGGNIQSYNQFNAGNECVLTLGAGEYYFKTFTAGTGLQIVIPQLAANEYVRICVQGKVEVSNGVNLQNNNGDFTTFMLYSDYQSTNDTDYAIKFASYHGTQQNYGVIVAPDGGVRFENGIKWTGAIWSKGLSLSNGCSLQSAV